MFHSSWRLLPPWLIFDKSNFLTQFSFQFRIPSIFVPCKSETTTEMLFFSKRVNRKIIKGILNLQGSFR